MLFFGRKYIEIVNLHITQADSLKVMNMLNNGN